MSAVDQHRSYAPKTLRFGVVTVSDSRGHGDDASGRAIQELAEKAGHIVATRRLVPDEAEEIRATVRRLVDPKGGEAVDVVVLTGGTGFSPRDVTVEALEPLLERRVDGFGELFRLLSHRQVGAAAMLSRATAGLVGERVVFALPGSPKAVVLAMEELILPEAAHLLGQVRRR